MTQIIMKKRNSMVQETATKSPSYYETSLLKGYTKTGSARAMV